MSFGQGLVIGQAMGWIECLAALAALGAVTIYILLTGQPPRLRLRWPKREGPADE